MLLSGLFCAWVCIREVLAGRKRGPSNAKGDSPSNIRRTVEQLAQTGQFINMVDYLENVEREHGTLVLDNMRPSLYNHLGVAYHISQRLPDSEQAFQKCVNHDPNDSRCWMNMGEAQLHQFRIDEGIFSYTKAVELGDVTAPARLLRAKGWSNNWQSFEALASMLEKNAAKCFAPNNSSEKPTCMLEGTSGLSYMNVPGYIHRETAKQLPSAQEATHLVDPLLVAPYWTKETLAPTLSQRNPAAQYRPRLKVGLLSSDFGVHPVATLLRGMIQFIDTSKIELFCFALSDNLSWWGTNISRTVEHFVPLSNMNTMDATMEIANRGVEILIDLNGHTLHSGISLMAAKPSPVQISFLGFPTTTGAKFIDYYMADPIALPAEGRDQFTEKIAYMPTSCIANDYAQMRGGVLELTGSQRADRARLKGEVLIDPSTTLFTTLSNFQKITPDIFHVWMNILQTVSGSKMMFIEYQGYKAAIGNIKAVGKMFGVDTRRMVLTPQAPWIDHLITKTSIDMILDTPAKNGHTTGLDGLWAGIPTVSLGGGRMMEQRAAESFAANFESYTGIAFSFKEYEDIAIEYSKNKRNMKLWRGHVERKRVIETLFDTKLWTRNTEKLLQAIWEAAHYTKAKGVAPFHILTLPPKGPPKILDVYQVSEEENDQSGTQRTVAQPRYLQPLLQKMFGAGRSHLPSDQEGLRGARNARSPLPRKGRSDNGVAGTERSMKPLPADFFKVHVPLLINIGGYLRKEGWVNVNSQPTSFGRGMGEVEVIRHLHDLQGFPNNSVDALYCSHSLEHVPFGDGTLEAAFAEWSRVLKPDGLLMVAVPDLEMMARLLLDSSLAPNERFFVSKMIYGAQTDSFDYHYSGFDAVTLPALLHSYNFCNIERVGNFNLFDDTSAMIYKGYPISLNIAAKKCRGPDDEMLYLDHAADPYEPFIAPTVF